jgi:hypothetical protein
VAAEAGAAEGVGFVEVVVEMDAVDECPLRIRRVLRGELQNRA